MSTLLFLAAALLAPPADAAISIRDPGAFRTQLAEMGYAPDPFEANADGGTTTSLLHLKDETMAVVLAGCTKGTACSHLVLVGSFVDVSKPPADWVAKRNRDYDLIKVWTREDDGRLAYSAGAVVEGLPRAAFRQWVQAVIDSSNDLARDAIAAGLRTKEGA